MPDRFSIESAAEHWSTDPLLAGVCEAAYMTVYQAEATRLAERGAGYRQIAWELDSLHPQVRSPMSYQDARNTCKKAFARLRSHLRLRERYRVIARDLLECARNRREGGDNRPPLVGVLPYVDEHKLRTERDPDKLKQYYRTVGLRTPTLTAEDFSLRVDGQGQIASVGILDTGDPRQLLQWVVEEMRAYPQVLATV